jgi:hypothetical protein
VKAGDEGPSSVFATGRPGRRVGLNAPLQVGRTTVYWLAWAMTCRILDNPQPRVDQPSRAAGQGLDSAGITALAIAASDLGTSRASWRLRIGPARTLRPGVLR